ncbi:RHS repeat-associated core domain-containing protein [Actinoplanes sp. NPDC049265]|uniref:RHS repeat-associated core domain-containing protein n=1 Tax=Actinoplanes sp. NPDC049265 TaxID=3363902 RepID=UPI00371A60A7
MKLVAPRPAPRVTPPKPYTKFNPAARASLPGAQQATVALPAAGKVDGRSAAPAPVKAGTTPISVSRARSGPAPQQVRVTTADQSTAQAAGVHGALFSLSATAGTGTVGVDVDASSFSNAYGGDYAARLRLVQLPACALSTPQLDRCRTQTPLRTAVTAPLATRLPLAGQDVVVLAATAKADGPTGDYKATSLSPGGTWSAGGNTGAFTYSYPIAVPPPIGGLAPTLSLTYDSTTQDARTAGSNNQSSWIGDGWSSTQNYIERTYQSCSEMDDSGAPAGSGDLCWSSQILTLSLNGHSTPIVYDDDLNTFRPADDTSTTKIEDLTGATNGTDNGTKNREYFRVTQDGVQYYFGLNRLPGWSGQRTTDSVWTVPVYKAHGGVADCPDGVFANTACTLGYRFNLDYVVDTNSNAMAYYYQPENGFYGANAKNTAVPFIRGGYLYRIDYGMTKATVYSATAPAQVLFDTTERCIKGSPAGNNCDDGQFTDNHPEYWPDTPVDLNCVKDATNCVMHSPSFWSRKRLASITTQIQVDGTPQPVDRYDLTQTFPDGGDHAPTLWLESIQRTGKSRLGEATTDTTTPAVTFNLEQLPNRVKNDGLPLAYHNRIRNITTEFGAETIVDYEAAPCSGLPDSDLEDQEDTKAQQFASTNTTGCQPVYWTPEGQPRPLIDWFHTYRVKRVSTIDQHNHYQDGDISLVSEYSYADPAWHYDDNEVVKKRYRTWGQFRGYGEVDLTTGDPSTFHKNDGAQVFDQKTLTKAFYFRGMNGDTLPGGRTRSVDPLTSQDGTVTVADHAAYAGREFETLTYTGAGSAASVDNATITVPTMIGPTATRSRTGLPALTAQMVRDAKTLKRQKVSTGWRRTEIDTFYNTTLRQTTTGMPTQVADRGDVAASGNTTQCSFTRYLDGAAAAMVVPAEKITTDQDCPSAGAAPAGNLIYDERTSYDGNPFATNADPSPARPAKGNPTLVQRASAASGATASSFIDMVETAYDDYGRVKSATSTPRSTAPAGGLSNATYSIAQTTYTRYTPATGALPKRVDTITQASAGKNCAAVTTSSADCHFSSVIMEQARQLPLTKTDAAGQKTSLTYDALGRLTAVWLPNKDKAVGAEANLKYTYKISKTSPNVVTTQTMLERPANATSSPYATSKVLYDGLLRQLETQTDGENGTTTVSDTQYDSHGWTVLVNNAYSVAAPPSDTLFTDRVGADMPSSTVTEYDAMGRPTQVTEEHDFRATWFTRTAYTGDTTTVIPPTGGVTTTKTTNARDQLTRLQQYTTLPTVSGNRTTGYSVNGGTSQNITYQYDAAGRLTTTIGPAGDNGTAGTQWRDNYDLLGRITSHIDPDTGTSVTNYDDAGNVTSTRDGRNNWLDFTYDLLGRKVTAIDRGANFKYASWIYDTLRIGKLTASTRWVKNVSTGYTVAVTGYSVLGKPAGQRITLPNEESPLPREYTTTYAYTPNTELLTSQTEPTVGRLSGETIDYNYTALGSPTSTVGVQAYVAGTVYNNNGQPSQITMGSATTTAAVDYVYDAQTRRLTGRTLSRTQSIGPQVDQTTYTYDPAGNPLSVVDKQSETGNTITDTQCYRYNNLARLTQAWTAAGDCPGPATAEPAAGSIAAGPGSYWQTFTYDKTGNRTQLVDHSTTGDADTTTTYTNGCQANCNSTGAQPDTLTATTGGPQSSTFRYNTVGQLIQRTPANAAQPGQNLTWDSEGRIAKVATTGANPTSTTYLYDADGNQLIRRDPGRSTLFAGDSQVVADLTSTPPALLGASRIITHGGTGDAVAIRSTLPDGGNHYIISDAHGTAGIAMETTTQALSRQQYKPYGEPRTTTNPAIWPDPVRGYLGAPKDATTGYTDLGARKYDPALGRFISADPVLDTKDPNQLGGYTYAGNNPITLSDPEGLRAKDPDLDDNTGKPKPINPPKYRDPPQGSGRPAHPSSSGQSKKEDHGFWGTFVDDLKATGTGTLQLAWDMNQCSTSYYGRDNCNRLKSTAIDQAKFYWDLNQCNIFGTLLGDPLGGCARATQKLGCTSDASATECAGHLTFFVASIVATEGVGRLFKMPIRCAGNSFAPATPVLMADGSTKPISKVEVGDRVLASDPVTGFTRSQQVTEVHINRDTDLADLTVKTRHGAATLHTTQHHPFWSMTQGRWVDADSVETLEIVATRYGTGVAVLHVRNFSGSAAMYNLTVNAIHTFYVLAAETPVLVHNCGGAVEGESGLAAAERARNEAGLKPDGAPNRQSPVYVGGYDAEGNVMGTGNGPRGSEIHAEDIIQDRMPGAKMTQPYAWRRNKITGELDWRPHTVCPRCQAKYPPSMFPPGTVGESGGVWGD